MINHFMVSNSVYLQYIHVHDRYISECILPSQDPKYKWNSCEIIQRTCKKARLGYINNDNGNYRLKHLKGEK